QTQVGQPLVQVVAGGDCSSRTVDANYHRFNAIVLGGFLDLLLGIARQTFKQNTVDADDSDPIMSELLARVMTMMKRSLCVRKSEGQDDDQNIKRDGNPEGEIEGP